VNAFARQSANNSFEVFRASVKSPDALVLPVVHDRQTSGPSCGAHALASVVNYWQGPGAASGDQIFATMPPQDSRSGYSIAELLQMAKQHGLLASGVRLSAAELVRELESGRPVLVPLRAPAIYVEPRSLPSQTTPVIGILGAVAVARVARISELTRLAMVDHYLVVVGHSGNRFVVVEPVRGYRTISFEKLKRYRKRFDDAAIVFSAPAKTAPLQSAQR
jgi:ABC-type bacteriocin/lantibiotic exporter with double-glycine peptidase domain